MKQCTKLSKNAENEGLVLSNRQVGVLEMQWGKVLQICPTSAWDTHFIFGFQFHFELLGGLIMHCVFVCV